jgi:hypothetical protein
MAYVWKMSRRRYAAALLRIKPRTLIVIRYLSLIVAPGGARWLCGQCARRAIVKAKQRSQ